MKTLIHHNDPGHGWIAVKRKELEELGIADKISRFSYQNGGTVYLEEDCDLGVYLQAYAQRMRGEYSPEIVKELVQFKDSYREVSPVRSYASYRAKIILPEAGKEIGLYGKRYTLEILDEHTGKWIIRAKDTGQRFNLSKKQLLEITE
jgi:hypothetical protein